MSSPLRPNSRLTNNQMNNLFVLMLGGLPTEEIASMIGVPKKTAHDNIIYIMNTYFDDTRLMQRIVCRLAAMSFHAKVPEDDVRLLHSCYDFSNEYNDPEKLQSDMKCIFKCGASMSPKTIKTKDLIPMVSVRSDAADLRQMVWSVVAYQHVGNDMKTHELHKAEDEEMHALGVQLRQLGQCCWSDVRFYNYINTTWVRYGFLKHLSRYRQLEKKDNLSNIVIFALTHALVRYFKIIFNRLRTIEIEDNFSGEKYLLKSYRAQALLEDLFLFDLLQVASTGAHNITQTITSWPDAVKEYAIDLIPVLQGYHTPWSGYEETEFFSSGLKKI